MQSGLKPLASHPYLMGRSLNVSGAIHRAIRHPDMTTVIECWPKLQSASLSCEGKQQS